MKEVVGGVGPGLVGLYLKNALVGKLCTIYRNRLALGIPPRVEVS